MESKKGRMSRVYTGDKKPASSEQVKRGGKTAEHTSKSEKSRTPRMGG